MDFASEGPSSEINGATEESGHGKTYRFSVSNGIFDHYGRIGEAIWLFLYCIDKTTTENPDGGRRRVGIVLGGKPIRDQDIADRFGCSVKTVRRWRIRLTREDYIVTTRTPYGFTYKVSNSKKWLKARGLDLSRTLRAQGGFGT